jgi:acetyl esterase/lipase
MDINQIHPTLRKATASFPKLPVTSGFGRVLTRSLLPMLLPKPKAPAGITIEQVKTAGGLKLRIYTPAGQKTRAAMLYIHGGGMMIGSPAMDDALLANTAAELDIVIVSPDYRLAPEHPYPAPVDDCHSAWKWMHENLSQRGIDANRIAIGGESAGGGLAAGLVLRIHDEGGPQPAAQWLFCPMLDDRTALDRSLDDLDHFVWNNKMNLVGWKSYLGKIFGTEQISSYAAPARRESLEGLPKAWIGVGDVELFFEEDKAYASKLTAAGVPCQLDIVTGAPHAFEGLAPDSELAKDYLAKAKSWLKAALGA